MNKDPSIFVPSKLLVILPWPMPVVAPPTARARKGKERKGKEQRDMEQQQEFEQEAQVMATGSEDSGSGAHAPSVMEDPALSIFVPPEETQLCSTEPGGSAK